MSEQDEIAHLKAAIERLSAAEATAYANGYQAALNDCDRADVAALITERDALAARLSFQKTLLSQAEADRDAARAALEKLTAASTEVHRLGARTGPQWPKLSAALIIARAAIREAQRLSDQTTTGGKNG